MLSATSNRASSPTIYIGHYLLEVSIGITNKVGYKFVYWQKPQAMVKAHI